MEDPLSSLAFLELQGGHYETAAELYRKQIEVDPDSLNWCGLALCKFGLVLEKKATVEEVFFCFRMAKEATPEDIPCIEFTIAQGAIRVTTEMYNRLIQIHQRLNNLSSQKSTAVLVGIGSFLVGEHPSSQNHFYRSLLAAGATAYNFHRWSAADKHVEELKKERSYLSGTLHTIRRRVEAHITERPQEKDYFNKQQGDLIKTFLEETTTSWLLQSSSNSETPTPKKKKRKKSWKKVLTIINRNPGHPFHLLKSNALQYFHSSKHWEAYQAASEALVFYGVDEELIKVQKASRRHLVRPIKTRMAFELLCILLLYLFKNSFLKLLPVPQRVFIFLLGLVFLIAVIKAIRSLLQYPLISENSE